MPRALLLDDPARRRPPARLRGSARPRRAGQRPAALTSHRADPDGLGAKVVRFGFDFFAAGPDPQLA
jgi:hypothetical protein